MPTRRQWRNSAFMGALLLGLGNGMVCIAEQSVSSGLAAVAVASVPLWIGLFAPLRGPRSNRLEWLGLGIGFVGEIGRASCRERVCQYVEVSVVAVSFQKKQKQQK